MRFRPHSVFGTLFAAGLLAVAAPAAAAGPKAQAQPAGRGLRVICQSPLVASTDGKSCVCPTGTVKQGDQCAPAPRAAPAGASTLGPKDAVGHKVAPTPDRGLRAVPQLGYKAPGKKTGLTGKKAGGPLTMQKNQLGFSKITTKSGEFGTALQVRKISSDVHTEWGISHAIQSAQQLTFRWTTQATNPQSAKRTVTGLTSNGSPLVLQDTATPLPTAAYAFFNFPFPAGYDAFVVKVTVVDGNGSSIDSVPVHIDFDDGNSGPTPLIQTAQVLLNIEEIFMNDDSDLHGSGEIDFCFWATYSGGANGTTGIVQHHDGDFPTGATRNPGVQVAIDALPQFVTLHVKGRDDDTTGGFTTADCNGSTSEYDFATGQRNLAIPVQYSSGTAKQPFADFKATGSEDLEFTVRGSWQIATPGG